MNTLFGKPVVIDPSMDTSALKDIRIGCPGSGSVEKFAATTLLLEPDAPVGEWLRELMTAEHPTVKCRTCGKAVGWTFTDEPPQVTPAARNVPGAYDDRLHLVSQRVFVELHE